MKTKSFDRHNFNPDYKLHLCCAQFDYLRPAFHFIHFMNGYAYATDAHIAIKAKIADISNFTEDEIAMLNNKSVHFRVFRQIIQRRNIEITSDGFVYTDNEGEFSQTFKFHDIDNERKINIDLFHDDTKDVVPDIESIFASCEVFEEKPIAVDRIGFNPECVDYIARAMNAERMTFTFSGKSTMIRVRPIYDRMQLDIAGILMPCLID